MKWEQLFIELSSPHNFFMMLQYIVHPNICTRNLDAHKHLHTNLGFTRTFAHEPWVHTNICPQPSVHTNICPQPSVHTNICPQPSVHTNICPQHSVHTNIWERTTVHPEQKNHYFSVTEIVNLNILSRYKIFYSTVLTKYSILIIIIMTDADLNFGSNILLK